MPRFLGTAGLELRSVDIFKWNSYIFTNLAQLLLCVVVIYLHMSLTTTNEWILFATNFSNTGVYQVSLHSNILSFINGSVRAITLLLAGDFLSKSVLDVTGDHSEFTGTYIRTPLFFHATY